MFRPFAAGVAASLVLACTSSSSSTGAPSDGDGGSAEPDAGPMLLPGCPLDPGPPSIEVDPKATIDPSGGPKKFTLEKALEGYPTSEGVLTALITTEKGTIRCELDENAAPITVANFVGLARGTRPFRPAASTWRVRRFYDGLLWHRVIPDFVIQGGDPQGSGAGGPGYDLPEENHIAEPLGTLAMAAGGAPNGSQFYIVVGKGPDAKYNVFGKCETETAKAIAADPRNASDKPVTDVHMLRIDIARCTK
jgi:peptidyl-prolyl cis-trans isomerase A (cyclophilin A)